MSFSFYSAHTLTGLSRGVTFSVSVSLSDPILLSSIAQTQIQTLPGGYWGTFDVFWEATLGGILFVGPLIEAKLGSHFVVALWGTTSKGNFTGSC